MLPGAAFSMHTRCALITLPGGWAGDASHVARHGFKRGPHVL